MFVGTKEELPWILPHDSSPVKFDVPKIGAELIIEFPYEDIYSPFYTGYWHNEANHDAYFDDNYPKTFGFKKDNLRAKFNDETKLGEIVHSSGKKIELKDDGSVTLTLQDLVALLGGKLEVTATGEVKITSTGNVTVEGDGQGKFAGKGGTDVGDAGGSTNVKGSTVMLAGGGVGVAVLGSQCIGTGNLGGPVVSNIIEGSSKVFAPK